MPADIILCEEFGPNLRFDHQAVNRCPCCGKKDFEVLVAGIDIDKAFAVFAERTFRTDPEMFHKMIIEIDEWSNEEDEEDD
jgi:hypothetical protein